MGTSNGTVFRLELQLVSKEVEFRQAFEDIAIMFSGFTGNTPEEFYASIRPLLDNALSILGEINGIPDVSGYEPFPIDWYYLKPFLEVLEAKCKTVEDFTKLVYWGGDGLYCNTEFALHMWDKGERLCNTVEGYCCLAVSMIPWEFVRSDMLIAKAEELAVTDKDRKTIDACRAKCAERQEQYNKDRALFRRKSGKR